MMNCIVTLRFYSYYSIRKINKPGGNNMKKLSFFLILAVILLLAPQAFSKTVSGLISMDFDLSHQLQGKEVQLWIPYPVTDEDQDISEIEISGDFAESAVYTDKVFTTPILYARWDKDAKSRKLSFSFHAKREEVERREFPRQDAAWDPADYSIYLAATRLGPVDGEVKKLAEKITADKQGVLEKAKAVYDWTVENTYRNPDTRGCGLGDVYRLLQEPGGKCADISSIYVALARAAGVPAREIFGIRMGKNTTQNISTWQHCWAEFYLPGYGWVPVDPADVRKMMLVEKLKPNHNKTKQYREYFWGGIDAFRIRLGEGRDLVLNPPQHGEPINYLMYPYAQVGETTLDWLAPDTFKYNITYHQLM
jgi:transglutaminase-like putative cysteine protease